MEACKTYYEQLNEKYKNNKNVKIYNKAIYNKDSEKIKLYYASDPDGHSIISSKKNLINEKKFELIETIKLSTFLVDINLKKEPNVVNILKANIEGAEYFVIKDLDATKMFTKFNYLIGAGWVTDMKKCSTLKDKITEALSILEKHNIKTYYFARGYLSKYNVDFDTLLKC